MPVRLSDIINPVNNTNQLGRTSTSPPPPPHDDAGNGEGSDDELPSFASSSTSRKRPAEDHTQFAMTTARNVRLKKEGEDKVVSFSKLSSPNQRIVLYAQTLAAWDVLKELNPPKVVFQVPITLEGWIEWLSFASIISPDCPAYVVDGGPSETVLGILAKHPQWGYTPEVKKDKAKSVVIERAVGQALTIRRNLLKSTIKSSMGFVKEGDREVQKSDPPPLDIVGLGEAVLAIMKKKKKEIVISIQLLGRLAFLRDELLKCIENPDVPDTKYWNMVDAKLKKFRDDKLDSTNLTMKFLDALRLDISLYGGRDRADSFEDSFVSYMEVN